jgi:hypothetical protein
MFFLNQFFTIDEDNDQKEHTCITEGDDKRFQNHFLFPLERAKYFSVSTLLHKLLGRIKYFPFKSMIRLEK